jgi:ATP-binding cassette subfamily B (MDR/TAP) protein 1
MSLLFGNLVQDFVNFETAISKASTNDPESSLMVEEAARAFRHAAAKDASYLTYMGA